MFVLINFGLDGFRLLSFQFDEINNLDFLWSLGCRFLHHVFDSGEEVKLWTTRWVDDVKRMKKRKFIVEKLIIDDRANRERDIMLYSPRLDQFVRSIAISKQQL